MHIHKACKFYACKSTVDSILIMLYCAINNRITHANMYVDFMIDIINN